MTNPWIHAGSDRNKGGVKLVVVAFVLGMLAVAADLAWMVPHRSTVAVYANPPAAHEQASPTTYFASQFSLPMKDSAPPGSALDR